ncbi:MAG: hypothetical protein ACLR0U_21170 [Enterocloster clostridioformis]
MIVTGDGEISWRPDRDAAVTVSGPVDSFLKGRIQLAVSDVSGVEQAQMAQVDESISEEVSGRGAFHPILLQKPRLLKLTRTELRLNR